VRFLKRPAERFWLDDCLRSSPTESVEAKSDVHLRPRQRSSPEARFLEVKTGKGVFQGLNSLFASRSAAWLRRKFRSQLSE
jgi:hypothetical protein